MPAEQRGSVYSTANVSGSAGAMSTASGAGKQGSVTFRRAQVARARRVPPDARRVVDEPLTLSEFSERYIERYAAGPRASHRQVAALAVVRPLQAFGDVRLSELRNGRDRRVGGDASPAVPTRRRARAADGARRCSGVGVPPEEPREGDWEEPRAERDRERRARAAEVDRLAGELRSPYDAAVVVGAWCYLRPGRAARAPSAETSVPAS
jgi:hypothetical protein